MHWCKHRSGTQLLQNPPFCSSTFKTAGETEGAPNEAVMLQWVETATPHQHERKYNNSDVFFAQL
jgi:hypothetical protein